MKQYKALWKKTLGIIPLLLMISLIFPFSTVKADSSQVKPSVFVMKIREEIDPRMSRYVELALAEAERIKADYIVVDMDTYGGAVDDADKIRGWFLKFPKPIFVFINKNAASAGALISISCDSIYMEPGSNIGAATVVTGDGQPAPDKYQSFMRSKMRATAEASGRDPKIAEGMVGTPIGTDSITVGKVISFSTDEAISNGYCEGKVNSIEEILKLNNIANAEVIYFETGSIDKIIHFFLNPYLRSLLLLLIIGGLYFELQTPGVGFPLAAAITAAVLYFVPSYLEGFAENWEILLFFAGIALIALEVFVIPGFGVAGIAGISLTMISLILVMVDNSNFDFTFVPGRQLYEAFFVAFSGLTGGIILIFVGGARFVKSKYFKRIALQDEMTASEGYTSNFISESMIGKTGQSHTVLRPSGKVMIEGTIYDAYTRGDYIEKGENIVVVEQMSTSLKVKKASH